MSLPNPLLQTQAAYFKPLSARDPSRSPSRSPVRKGYFTARERDPLLDNLSPDSTLKVLSSADPQSHDGPGVQDALARSIAETSRAERGLGLRAALAAQKLRHWQAEISGWPWPSLSERAAGKGFLPPASPNGLDTVESKTCYNGSLTADVVALYEGRIDEIQHEMEALEVDDLKEYLLDAYIPSRSRPSSAHVTDSDVQRLGYAPLRDFTAVITATIIQALPHLARLQALLATWDTRLSVLTRLPTLLEKLEATKQALTVASEFVRAPNDGALLSKVQFEKEKEGLGKMVAVLGSDFDLLLDMLEGSDDSLPETWIEEMDVLESDYADWVVTGEWLVLRNDLKTHDETSSQDLPDRHSSVFVGSVPELDHTGKDNPNTPPKSTSLPVKSGSSSPVISMHMINALITSGGRSTSISTGAEHESGRIPTKQLHISAAQPQGCSRESQDAGDIHEEPSSAENLEVPASRRQSLVGSDSFHQWNIADHVNKPNDLSSYSLPGSRDFSEPELALAAFRLARTSQAHSTPSRRLSGAEASSSSDQPSAQALEDESFVATPRGGAENPFPLSRAIDYTYKEERKPIPNALQLPQQTHKREISDVSVPDSLASETFSDISYAEIADARTERIGTPTVTLIDNPFRPSRDDQISLSDMARPRVQSMHLIGNDFPVTKKTSHNKAQSLSLITTPLPGSESREPILVSTEPYTAENLKAPVSKTWRPSMLYNASVASLELVEKSRIRSIVVDRSSSRGSRSSLLVSPIEQDDTMPDTRKALRGTDSPFIISPIDDQPSQSTAWPLAHGLSTHEQAILGSNNPRMPIPRRSSKRRSRGPDDFLSLADSPVPEVRRPSSPETPVNAMSIAVDDTDSSHHEVSPSPRNPKTTEDALEARIQSLLTTLPSRIKFNTNTAASDTGSPPSTADSTRSTTTEPALILSPARLDRTRARPPSSDSDVKMYHLSRSDQSRDIPPMKLFVRLVGQNGERVMVRVGGGWADLGEYLREYSLHHGKHSINDGRLEVATMPTNGHAISESVIGSSPLGIGFLSKAGTTSGRAASKSYSVPHDTSRPGSAEDTNPSGSLDIRKAQAPSDADSLRRGSPESFSASPMFASPEGDRTDTPWTSQSSPPPFQTSSSTTTTTSISHSPGSPSRVTTTSTPPMTTIYSPRTSTPLAAQKYTPLGAAGPRSAINKPRSASHAVPSTQESDAWVKGLMGRARGASGKVAPSNFITTTSPTTTTTTSISTPRSREPKSVTSTPASDSGGSNFTNSPSPSSARTGASRPKSTRLSSLGDVGGIKRVFLRQKDK